MPHYFRASTDDESRNPLTCCTSAARRYLRRLRSTTSAHSAQGYIQLSRNSSQKYVIQFHKADLTPAIRCLIRNVVVVSTCFIYQYSDGACTNEIWITRIQNRLWSFTKGLDLSILNHTYTFWFLYTNFAQQSFSEASFKMLFNDVKILKNIYKIF